MEDNGPNQWKRHNAFKGFVDKPLGYKSSSADENHDQKKVKLNSEAPLSTLEQQVLSLPLPKFLVSAFKDNPTSVKFQLFVSRSYSPPASTSPQPVYTLKITSDSNSSAEVETDGGTTPMVTETRLVAEGQIQLQSRL
ncbi:PREDICTED: uncharacterized protein LOC109353013 [Lupinus angustifolius]|uniref:uncharacterized protein LOC109353013 n=1 Tax=Lupinus angustifolius TaxID=3871 RepID=UPI00092E9074|nr:PREDICTED: uncharacterized protein LOC109353013 [Lupinus angustifolius]